MYVLTGVKETIHHVLTYVRITELVLTATRDGHGTMYVCTCTSYRCMGL